MLRQLRNNESHGSMNLTEQEVDAALRIVIDMYLFVTGMNITELEAAGYDADEMQRESTVIPVHSYSYNDESSPEYSMAAESFILFTVLLLMKVLLLMATTDISNIL